MVFALAGGDGEGDVVGVGDVGAGDGDGDVVAFFQVLGWGDGEYDGSAVGAVGDDDGESVGVADQVFVVGLEDDGESSVGLVSGYCVDQWDG